MSEGHLTRAERDRIAQLHQQGHSQAAIARTMGRHPSTISRELGRNATNGEYLAAQAQECAERRRRERSLTRKLDRPELQARVRSGLAKYWSPEQIAGRLRREHANQREWRCCPQSIYDWIKADEHRRHWESFLRRRGKRRPRRRNPQAAGRARLASRPQFIDRRERLGDFEGDTVLGSPGTGGLTTLVDRASRFSLLAKIETKDADHVHRHVKRQLQRVEPGQRHTLTFDNGTEFARCQRPERNQGLKRYGADPGCPYQRGTNENTNGLIRQFLPKGTSFEGVTWQQVREIETLLNNRPRKCLGYATPAEVFHQKTTPQRCD